MADVFVSYARADKTRVAPLVAAIESKGWSVWWDPEITPGQEFDDKIDAELMCRPRPWWWCGHKPAALEMLEPLFATITVPLLRYLKDDPDFDPLRGDPRYQAMVTAAEARLAATQGSAAPESEQPA